MNRQPARYGTLYLVPMFSRRCVSIAVFYLFTLACITQAQSSASQTQGAVSTGAAHPAVLDSEKRPITAGGFVDHGPIIFQDLAQKAGLAAWRHVMGTAEKKFILETVGSGVALLDYDNDGWVDIYFVNGSTYDAARQR